MRLSVARLLSDTLTLDLPRKGGGEPNRLEVEHGVNVRGTIDTSDGVRLERIAADTLDLHRARWTFGTRPLTTEPMTLQGLAIDLRVPKGDSPIGTINVRELAARTIVFGLGPERRLVIERVAAHEVAMRFIRDGLIVEIGTLDLGSGELELGDTHVKWRNLRAKRVLMKRDEATGVTLQVGELKAEGLSVMVERLGHGKDPEAAKAPSYPPMDWHFLDGLQGQVDIDLTVDMKVPVIKRRNATHEFRIPIHDGTIDFHAAERQLAFLEDTLIDFEVEDHRLILEKDIPLMSKADKVIVYWPLDVDAHALATRNLARLRTLVNVKKPERTALQQAEDLRDKDKEKSVKLLGIDADPINIELALGRGATPFRGGSLTFGRGGNDGAGKLKVQGALHYRPEGEDQPVPGELHISVDDIGLGLKNVAFGKSVHVSGNIVGNVDDVTVRFSGFSPQHVGVEAESAELKDVLVTFA